MIIYLDATTEQLEEALPFTKGQWKPITVPVFSKEEIEKVGIIDLTKTSDEYRWTPAIPNK